MGSFVLCIVQYLVIMAVLAVIGFAGAFCGVKLRKSKSSKAVADENSSK